MSQKKAEQPNVFKILTPYKGLLGGVLLFALLSSGLNLLIPKIMAKAIDEYSLGILNLQVIVWQFSLVAIGTFVFAYFQSIAQTYVGEKVARDLREKVIAKISNQSYSYIQEVTSSKLLTNLTGDIDAIKMFAGQAVVSIISSIFLLVGGTVLLLLIDWKLALTMMSILPVMGLAFFLIFSRAGPLFKKAKDVVDWLNDVINESVVGAGLIRVINSQIPEYNKFVKANTEAKDVGLKILALFATIIPIIGLVANLATLAILLLGGHFVISESMTLGNFTAFINYLSILIFPIMIIGFMSSTISQAAASYGRISDTLHASEKEQGGSDTSKIDGRVELKNVSLSIGEKNILKDVSFSAAPGSKLAILGPTAAGKTHILYLLIGLLDPQKGEVIYDTKALKEYDHASLHEQVGFVFQDSSIFNLTLRENIAFSSTVKEEDIAKAIETAELNDFIKGLPKGLDTIASERGVSLSGGQKQRLMLARALALNPRVLLLDDFTARVDEATEKTILTNIEKNYPELTLISVTQKISSVKHYEKIVLLMEGEVLAEGTHEDLLEKSPEYVQIFESQKSTSHLEKKTS